jgi:hypothetical protein
VQHSDEPLTRGRFARGLHLLLAMSVVTLASCHPGPPVQSTAKDPVLGTIAGIVSTDANGIVVGRKVTAVDVSTGKRYTATTGKDGGYSMLVSAGTYRLDVEQHSGETIVRHPDDTHVGNADIDSGRDFVLASRGK